MAHIFQNGLECLQSTAYSAINKAIMGQIEKLALNSAAQDKVDQRISGHVEISSEEGLKAWNNVVMHNGV